MRFQEKNSSSSNIDITDSSIKYYSTPINEDNRQQINYHLKRIHQQIEADRHQRKNQYKEMENISHEMKSLKDVMQETKTSKSSPEQLPKDSHEHLSAQKRKILKQQATIQLLTEQLEKKEKDAIGPHSGADDTQLKLLERQLNQEESERMKIMKDYTNVQQRLTEADRERSELLFALSDVKAEARSILLAYEETSQSLPELKSLLELSAKQKSEFSNQVTRLKNEAEEYIDEIAQLKENTSKYLTIINKTESEKHSLNRKVEETQSKYINVNKELKTANQKLLEATQSFNDMEKSKQQLQDKALNTLKSYRSKCRKYEKDIQGYIEQYKIKEIELTKSISQSKELEIENLKQMHQFQDLSSRMEELQGSITMYVGKCHQVSDEKSELEMILSQTNDQSKEYYALLSEQQKLKSENCIVKSELRDEKKTRLEFENLCQQYYDNNVSLKKEKSALQLEAENEKNAIEVERNDHKQLFSNLQEQNTISAKEGDMKLTVISESNQNLIKQLEMSAEHSKEIEEKYENVKISLDQQKIHTNNEEAKSKILIKKLKLLAKENKKIRTEFEMEKQKFDEKLKTFQSIEFTNEERNAVLQEHVDNAQKVEAASKGNFKTIINIITQDTNNLLNMLCHEKENRSPVKEIPKDRITDYQIEMVELRGKMLTCFSITKTLKERYNQQKQLIRRARERIKSQVQDIHHLTESQNKESERYQEEISAFEIMQQNNNDVILKLESENSKLHTRINDLTKDLEECTKALHKCLELDKDRKTVLNEIDLLNLENKERQKIDENLFRATERIEVITEQLSEAKISFNELKQQGMDKSDYTDRLIESFQSISPSKKRRMHNDTYI